MENRANTQQDTFQELTRMQRKLEERNRQLELISQIGTVLTSELALEKVVQQVTDVATQVSGAKFGALFYKRVNERGEEHTLYTLSGADRKDFHGMHTLRNTPLLAPTFNGEGPIRSDDITQDPRYGHNRPHHGMPQGHLFLRSYLALPVVSRSGEVLGGLFFGHPEPGVFTQYAEDLLVGIAAQAAVAIDNARLFEARQEAELRVRLILESLPQIAWTTDPQGRVEYYNSRWQEYTGLAMEMGQGDGWQKVVHPEDLASSQTAWRKALETGETLELENRLLRAQDGSYRWHVLRGVPLRDSEGRVTRWVGSCTDVHEFKQVQQRLAQKNEELLRINEDLDNFVYRASHDLKAPVINITQLIRELHRQAIFQVPKAEMMEKMLERSLDQLQGTIQDLSDIVKAQRSEAEAAQWVSLSGMVEEVLTSLSVAVAETGAGVRLDLQEAPSLWFNRGNLKSILYNLICNALKYRASDRVPQITIRSTVEPGYVRLSVADNGLGMDLERRGHKLFQMFSRLHDHVPGSGVGLYIVHRIIRNHGGRIEVESQEGAGTTFHLFFPKA